MLKRLTVEYIQLYLLESTKLSWSLLSLTTVNTVGLYWSNMMEEIMLEVWPIQLFIVKIDKFAVCSNKKSFHL